MDIQPWYIDYAWAAMLSHLRRDKSRGGVLFVTQACVVLKWISTQLDIFISW